MRPFSQACENNKQPILAVLRRHLAGVDTVLELGSGTGQHARYFAEQLPGLRWQATDLADNLPGIEAWREDYPGDNLPPPHELDVTWPDWGIEIPGAIFTANSLHIMPWVAAEALFAYLGPTRPPAIVCWFTGPSTTAAATPATATHSSTSGWRHSIPAAAFAISRRWMPAPSMPAIDLLEDVAMPANNRLLVWQ